MEALLCLFFCGFMNFLFGNEFPEKEMVILIPSYNNEEWCEKNLQSALNQDYTNYRIIYINDCSTDSTQKKVIELAKSQPKSFRIVNFDNSHSDDIAKLTRKFQEEMDREEAFFTMVNNFSRCGALENIYLATYSCRDHEIMIQLDGDDWLLHDGVLKKINAVYSSGVVWMTHGTLVEYPSGNVTWNEPIEPEWIKNNQVRQFKCPSHLRTYYTWIFKKIALEDLFYEGKFFQMTCDMAIMFPILEMAAERHAFIAEPIYSYNMINPINDGKVDQDLQNEMDRYIRSKKPYQRLE